MNRPQPPLTWHRRRFLKRALLGSATFFSVAGAYAEELTRTPAQTEGPFYPNHLPLDTDNDLIILNDSITPAVGEITHLSGKILDHRGDPIRNATLEIWQVGNNGAYLHTGDSRHKMRDANFQGYGRFLTGSTGEYYFRTVKPVPYPGRAPHIHFIVKRGNQKLLTSQCYVNGHPQNEKDGIFRSLGNDQNKKAVSVDFLPIANSQTGELNAKFDIVIGQTPA